MDYEWDQSKAAANLKKHGVAFADAALALGDPLARTIPDPDAMGESRFICMGADPTGRLLVTVFAPVVLRPELFHRAKPAGLSALTTSQSDEKGIRLFEG